MILRQHVQHVKDTKKSNPIPPFRKASFLKFATLQRDRKWHISKLTTLPRAPYQPHAINNDLYNKSLPHKSWNQKTMGRGRWHCVDLCCNICLKVQGLWPNQFCWFVFALIIQSCCCSLQSQYFCIFCAPVITVITGPTGNTYGWMLNWPPRSDHPIPAAYNYEFPRLRLTPVTPIF